MSWQQWILVMYYTLGLTGLALTFLIDDLWAKWINPPPRTPRRLAVMACVATALLLLTVTA